MSNNKDATAEIIVWMSLQTAQLTNRETVKLPEGFLFVPFFSSTFKKTDGHVLGFVFFGLFPPKQVKTNLYSPPKNAEHACVMLSTELPEPLQIRGGFSFPSSCVANVMYWKCEASQLHQDLESFLPHPRQAAIIQLMEMHLQFVIFQTTSWSGLPCLFLSGSRLDEVTGGGSYIRRID